jgi:hypothetical protein
MPAKLARILSSVIVSTLAFAASAQTPNPEWICNNNDLAPVLDLISHVRRVSQILPNVPPEDERYFQAEERVWLEVQVQPNGVSADARARAWQRQVAVSKRPLYGTYRLRISLAYAREAVESLTLERGPRVYDNRDGESLRRAVIAAAPVRTYASELSTYLASQDGAQLAKSEREELADAPKLLSSQLDRFMQCKLTRLMTPGR